jgi:hypothetical protein
VPIAGLSHFSSSILESILIPAEVTIISADCFVECPALTAVTFAACSQLKRILSKAFSRTELKGISIPPSVEILGSYCFYECKSLRKVELPLGLQMIEPGTFSKTGLTSVSILRNVQIIGEFSFFECQSLEEVEFEPDSQLTRIESWAFAGTALQTISLPASLEHLGSGCFMDCAKLVDVGLATAESSDPDGLFEFQSHLRQIEDSVFLGTKLATVCLPATVKQVDDRAFPYDCILHVLGCEKSVHDLCWINECHSARSAGSPRPLEGGDGKLSASDLRELKPIGSGGSSAVYEYQYKTRKLAGKRVSAEDVRPEWFEREIELLIRLDHPCIIGFAGFRLAEPDDEMWHGSIFMDIAENGCLGDVLWSQRRAPRKMLDATQKEPLDATQKAKIILGIALGLNLIHAAGVIHRDIKPANILLDEEWRPMICDFGCARVASNKMTASVGTLWWQAPELWEITSSDQRYTNKVDIWAFGLVMYQVLSEGKLWSSDIARDFGKLQYGILNGRRPDIQNDPERQWVWDLIQKCWERDPNNRPTMPQILATLKENRFEVAKGVDHEKVMEYFLWVEMNRVK